MSDLIPIRSYKVMYLRPDHVTDNVIVFRYFCIIKQVLFNRQPDLEGKLVFSWKDSVNKKFLRITRLSWRVRGKNFPQDPDKAVILLKKVKILVIDEKTDKLITTGLTEFLKTFQISAATKVGKVCPSCFVKERITLLNKKRSYTDDLRAKKQVLCRRCMVEEVERELKLRGIKATKELSLYSLKILDNTKKLSQVINFFEEGQNLGAGTLIKGEKMIDTTEGVTITEKISDAKIDPRIKKLLLDAGLRNFMPIQRLALARGLLEGKSQLIMANTSAGKTLVGEIAGLSALLSGKKFLFCVPLVALANTKYEEFKRKYPDYKINLRTGRSRLKLKKSTKRKFGTAIEKTNIIVGTYEGMDQYLRGGSHYKNVGCVVIDEIQSLSDPERGPYLDGLISRLKISSKAQLICLSATIGNPIKLAKDLGIELVLFRGRPVPLEQHMIIVRNDEQKHASIIKLIKEERKKRSKQGFKGQTIVFTNARRKARDIAAFARSKGLFCSDYHAGLPYYRRKIIEEAFFRGKNDAVVATYALGAGVDFPASMVVFESLMMGNKLLTSNYYHQMTGRAGRLGMHDKGIAVILAKPEPPVAVLSNSEIEIGMKLVNAPLDNVEPMYTDLECANQILATISFYKECTLQLLAKVYGSLIGAQSSLKIMVKDLLKKELIKINRLEGKEGVKVLVPTPLGRAGSVSFLSIDEIMLIKERLEQKTFSIANLVIELEPFETIYINSRIMSLFEEKLRIKTSSRFLNSAILDLLSDSSDFSGKLESKIIDILKRWKESFYSSCNCKETPYCEHGVIMLNRRVLDLRRKGNDPEEISRYFEKKYALQIYGGDILKWLELVIFKLEGIARITRIIFPASAVQVEKLRASLVHGKKSNKTFNTKEEQF
ncbi:MAG: DEAD/DEAH box helicase [Candidatus Hodarchaeales archaeon]|jgi:helicase